MDANTMKLQGVRHDPTQQLKGCVYQDANMSAKI